LGIPAILSIKFSAVEMNTIGNLVKYADTMRSNIQRYFSHRGDTSLNLSLCNHPEVIEKENEGLESSKNNNRALAPGVGRSLTELSRTNKKGMFYLIYKFCNNFRKF
jgi:hypothetical protein